jgi:hypothetical protein
MTHHAHIIEKNGDSSPREDQQTETGRGPHQVARPRPRLAPATWAREPCEAGGRAPAERPGPGRAFSELINSPEVVASCSAPLLPNYSALDALALTELERMEGPTQVAAAVGLVAGASRRPRAGAALAAAHRMRVLHHPHCTAGWHLKTRPFLC